MEQSIEVKVHQTLREMLRQQSDLDRWTHHLTMARLVARAMRVSKSALIQTGLSAHIPGEKYRISYLVPALLWEPIKIVVVLPHLQSELTCQQLPQLQAWLGTNCQIHGGKLSDLPQRGIWVLTLPEWLSGILAGWIPQGIPTILDGLDELESWIDRVATLTIGPQSWLDLQAGGNAGIQTKIATGRIELAAMLWQHPPNPYNSYELDRRELLLLSQTIDCCDRLPPDWAEFKARLDNSTSQFISAQIDRSRGTFDLSIAPTDPTPILTQVWQHQPLVAIAGFVDLQSDAATYRQQLPDVEITPVKFSPDRRSQLCQLYLPRWMPLPNTAKFQPILTSEIDRLLNSIPPDASFFVAILVQDTPLLAQLAATLAARWGTRVKVETTAVKPTDIIVCGWDFWRDYSFALPSPQLMIIATLPIPSLEDPAIAARVKIYKQNKQDWFRLFLLPAGLRLLHQAIAPLRSTQGTIAIFDNRIDRRSYGQQILAALSPIARIDRPDWN
jgi:ATP-dependent DNA helicase DinG